MQPQVAKHCHPLLSDKLTFFANCRRGHDSRIKWRPAQPPKEATYSAIARATHPATVEHAVQHGPGEVTRTEEQILSVGFQHSTQKGRQDFPVQRFSLRKSWRYDGAHERNFLMQSWLHEFRLCAIIISLFSNWRRRARSC